MSLYKCCIDIKVDDTKNRGMNMYHFQKLPQLIDKRRTLPLHSKHPVPKRRTPIRDCERGIHHSATRVHLKGSNPEAFANYHVNVLNWPCIGYTFTITPSRIIDTPRGQRAEISYNRNLDDLTYHVGNSNDFSLGICIAGDYRYDTMTEAAKLSFVELNEALDRDNIAMGGMVPHNRYPGYSTTECPVYDPFKIMEEVRSSKTNSIVIAKGDTLWGISRKYDVSVEELKRLNNIEDVRKLQIGQELLLRENYYDYEEITGRFKNESGYKIFVRKNAPSIYEPVVTMLNENGTIKYDRKYYNQGYLWVSHVYNGIRRYTPVGTVKNKEVLRLWGKFY